MGLHRGISAGGADSSFAGFLTDARIGLGDV